MVFEHPAIFETCVTAHEESSRQLIVLSDQSEDFRKSTDAALWQDLSKKYLENHDVEAFAGNSLQAKLEHSFSKNQKKSGRLTGSNRAMEEPQNLNLGKTTSRELSGFFQKPRKI